MSKNIFKRLKSAVTYFGLRQVKNAASTEKKVIVEYVEGEPAFESMNPLEWEAGKTDKPVEMAGNKLQEWFVKRTTPLRTEMASVIEKYNPRMSEMEKIMKWVMEGFVQTFQKAVDGSFGKENFFLNGSFDEACKRIEEKGGDVYGSMDGKVHYNGHPVAQFQLKDKENVEFVYEKPVNRKMVDIVSLKDWMENKTVKPDNNVCEAIKLLRNLDMPLNNILSGVFFMNVKGQTEKIINKALSVTLGSTDETRRVMDIKLVAEEYAGSPKKEGDK